MRWGVNSTFEPLVGSKTSNRATSATVDGHIFQMVMPKAASEELERAGCFEAVAAALAGACRSTGLYMGVARGALGATESRLFAKCVSKICRVSS
jgi:hypothetical protein